MEDGDIRIITQALKNALNPSSSLYRSMVHHNITSMEEALAQAEGFIWLEEEENA